MCLILRSPERSLPSPLSTISFPTTTRGARLHRPISNETPRREHSALIGRWSPVFLLQLDEEMLSHALLRTWKETQELEGLVHLKRFVKIIREREKAVGWFGTLKIIQSHLSVPLQFLTFCRISGCESHLGPAEALRAEFLSDQSAVSLVIVPLMTDTRGNVIIKFTRSHWETGLQGSYLEN